MKKMQMVALPEESKQQVEELVTILRDEITKYAESKNFTVHPAVAFLATDILRNAVTKELIQHCEKNQSSVLPAFQMGVA